VLSVEVLTLFPRMVAAPLAESILGKAQEKGLLRARVTDIRDFAEGRHHVTDDAPYGGGAGMVMKPEPLVAAIEAARARAPQARVILLSPQGARFDQQKAASLAAQQELIFVCGRYEGVDERILGFIDEELSLGDFVLTGGELAALSVIDAVARLVPGVLGNDESAVHETFAGDSSQLLEGPHYTRPPEFRGLKVPDALLSGDHARIARWRRQQALVRTRARRPDLFGKLDLTPQDRVLLQEDLDAVPVLSDR
jgi:tRNA (guanine37-N1)-methyltransferase